MSSTESRLHKSKEDKVEETREKARVRALNRRKKLKQEKESETRLLLLAQVENEQLKTENVLLKARCAELIKRRSSGACLEQLRSTHIQEMSLTPAAMDCQLFQRQLLGTLIRSTPSLSLKRSQQNTEAEALKTFFGL